MRLLALCAALLACATAPSGPSTPGPSGGASTVGASGDAGSAAAQGSGTAAQGRAAAAAAPAEPSRDRARADAGRSVPDAAAPSVAAAADPAPAAQAIAPAPLDAGAPGKVLAQPGAAAQAGPTAPAAAADVPHAPSPGQRIGAATRPLPDPHVASAPRREKVSGAEWVCLPWMPFAVRLREGEVECASTDGNECLDGVCHNEGPGGKPWRPPAGMSLVRMRCGQEYFDRHGADGYRNAGHFCFMSCEALQGCTPRFAKRPPPAGPPAELQGESPCHADADCSVSETSSCCGCKGLAVVSRLKKPARPPACGCADQGGPRPPRLSPDGELEADDGPCGRPPPPAGDYRAVCRASACVGLHR